MDFPRSYTNRNRYRRRVPPFQRRRNRRLINRARYSTQSMRANLRVRVRDRNRFRASIRRALLRDRRFSSLGVGVQNMIINMVAGPMYIPARNYRPPRA